jgi:hypothetical protein
MFKRAHPEGQPNYLSGSRNPFPLNLEFKSTPVLDDNARELIWKKVMQEGETLKAVSAELGVDITRVAAVVRLKEVEKDWVAKVCTHFLPFHQTTGPPALPTPFVMILNYPIRLVFKTSTWLQTLVASLSDPIRHLTFLIFISHHSMTTMLTRNAMNRASSWQRLTTRLL